MKISQAEFAGSSTRVGQRPKRRLPEFAFIGRSNVGKSSLINSLCRNRKLAMTSATPGKTKLVNHFLINDSWYLVDLPGYGFASLDKKGRDALKALVRDYIHNSEELTQLFVLVDSRHDIGAIDIDFLAELGEQGIPCAIIYTKCDKIGPNVLKDRMDRNARTLLKDWEQLPPVFTSSSETGAGREEILQYIDSIIQTL